MAVKRLGNQTIKLMNPPSIIATSTVVGPKEGEGPLSQYFDLVLKDDYFGTESWEKAESKMLEHVVTNAINNSGKQVSEINYLIAGDLLNQIISSSFAARTLQLPFLGVYGACSTMAESLSIGAMLIDGGYADNLVCATSSHYSSAERQYRFPLEQGVQRPPTAQWTVTGAGASVMSQSGASPYITHITIGKVMDFGIKDANNMGAAMAPAAADTISAHFKDIGVERSADYLDRFGITTIQRKGAYNDMNLASMALGGLTHGVKPVEMTAAYSVFPNKGVYIKPISFTKIIDRDGNVLIENKPIKERVISEQVAYMMVSIMKGVINGGTGGNAALSNMPAAGKTGTTTKNVDAWFIGYTPYYTATVWIGHDDNKPMNFTGGKYPAIIWKSIMTKAHENLAYKDFDRPTGLVTEDVCSVSGKLPTELCANDPRGSKVISETFVAGTEPKEGDVCDVHVVRDIDTSTNELATPYCPASLVQSKVFIQRPEPFVPSSSGRIPGDYIYEAPTKYCSVHGGESTPPTDTVPTIPATESSPTPTPTVSY